jgi:hypothetical protein
MRRNRKRRKEECKEMEYREKKTKERGKEGEGRAKIITKKFKFSNEKKSAGRRLKE